MENNDIITLRECIDITDKFIHNIISKEEFEAFGNRMTIMNYIPIENKLALIIDIIFKYKFTNTSQLQEIKIGELYRTLFFYVILGAYGMVDCSEPELITYENYDLLYPLFGSFILSYCKEDYDLFKSMLDDTINMYNLFELVDSITTISEQELEKTNKEHEELLESLETKVDLIQNLKDIAVFNDPNTSRVVDELKKIAKEKALAK